MPLPRLAHEVASGSLSDICRWHLDLNLGEPSVDAIDLARDIACRGRGQIERAGEMSSTWPRRPIGVLESICFSRSSFMKFDKASVRIEPTAMPLTRTFGAKS